MATGVGRLRAFSGARIGYGLIALVAACSASEPNPPSVSGGAGPSSPSASGGGGGVTDGASGAPETPQAGATGGGAAGAAGGDASPDASGGGGQAAAAGGGSEGGSASGGEGGQIGASGSASGGTSGTPGISGDPGAYILTDNFDSTAGELPDSTKWEPYEEWAVNQGFAPALDATKAHSPPNSVRVTSSNTGLGSFLIPIGVFPVEGNTFYVRVFINWEKATSTIMGHSGFLVGATARDNSGVELRLGISSKGPGDEAMMDLNLIGGGGGEVTRYSNGFTDGGNPGEFSGAGFQYEADRWYCVEAFFGGGSAAEFRVWIDETELEEMHVLDFQGSQGGEPRTDWAPEYTVLKIGAQDYDANLGHIWYDDVVISSARVGCQ